VASVVIRSIAPPREPPNVKPSNGYRHLKDPPCGCRPIRVEDLDELVWAQVSSLLERPELIREEMERRRAESLNSDPLEQRRGQLAQELKRVEQQIDKLLDAYQEGLLPLGQLRHRMPDLRRKQQTAEKELENARWQALVGERTAQLEQSLESFVGPTAALSPVLERSRTPEGCPANKPHTRRSPRSGFVQLAISNTSPIYLGSFFIASTERQQSLYQRLANKTESLQHNGIRSSP